MTRQGFAEDVLGLQARDGAGGCADGAVAGAAAEVATHLVIDLPRCVHIAAVAGFEHAHDDARCAVAALRAQVVHKLLLGGMQFAVLGQAFDGDDLFSVQHGQQQQAGVYSPPGWAACGLGVEHSDGAGTAIPFSAALFGAFKVRLLPQKIKQGAVGRGVSNGDRAPVDGKTQLRHAPQHNTDALRYLKTLLASDSPWFMLLSDYMTQHEADDGTAQDVPVVELSQYLLGDPEDRVMFVQSLGDAIKDFGFVRVAGHNVTQELMERAYDVSRRFFELDSEAKESYVLQGGLGQRGYTPFGAERAKDNPIPDSKEYWHVGRELPANHRLFNAYERNLWPKEVHGFKDILVMLYESLESCADVLLEALALYLDQSMDTFTRLTLAGNSVLRLLHYPAVDPQQMLPGAVRSAPHEDINFLTLMMASTATGLQLKRRDGSWMAVKAQPGELIVDSGDMLSRITNGLIPATTQRVVNPEETTGSRFSMPFFVHPRPDSVLRVLANCTGDGFPQAPADITGVDFLEQRLREQGLDNL